MSADEIADRPLIYQDATFLRSGYGCWWYPAWILWIDDERPRIVGRYDRYDPMLPLPQSIQGCP
jgi:hypothetical protein